MPAGCPACELSCPSWPFSCTIVLLRKRQPFRVAAQYWPCLQIIMKQQDDMTRTREMQIQQLEMQGRKRRGRPPGSKNKPKSDVSGGLEIREFLSSAGHVLSGASLLVRPAQGGQQED